MFIGMVSKKCNENDIRVMFSAFGQIEECRILRGPDGLSRGESRRDGLRLLFVLHCASTRILQEILTVFETKAGWLRMVSEQKAKCLGIRRPFSLVISVSLLQET